MERDDTDTHSDTEGRNSACNWKMINLNLHTVCKFASLLVLFRILLFSHYFSVTCQFGAIIALNGCYDIFYYKLLFGKCKMCIGTSFQKSVFGFFDTQLAHCLVEIQQTFSECKYRVLHCYFRISFLLVKYSG